MAKVKVGGTDGLIDRHLLMMGWAATADVAQQQRKDSLKALDLCEKMLSQLNGLSYRRVRGSIQLNAAATTVAVPADIDLGMDFTIEHPSGHGKIRVLPPDEFAGHPTALPYDRIDKTPVIAMVAIDPADSAMKFFFRISNTTGGNLVYPMTYQQIVVNLIDAEAAAGSVSLLPEGYELTLLLRCAEQFSKSRKNYPDVAMLTPDLQSFIASFYDKYRSNKKEPVTDSNKERRKIETDSLQPIAR